MITGKHVGPEIASSDGVVSDELNSSPPLSVEQSSVSQPVRNGLLAYANAFAVRGGVLGKELSKAVRKRRLASGNLNGPLEGGNVVYLHSDSVTRNRVPVNKQTGLTAKEVSCTVLAMPTTKRKPARAPGATTAPGRKTEPIVGPDGFTMSQRVLQLMAEQGMSQTDLARACSQYYAAFIKDEPDRVKQQHIFNIVQGQDSSWVVPLIAAVFEVSSLWLQLGIGKRVISKH